LTGVLFNTIGAASEIYGLNDLTISLISIPPYEVKISDEFTLTSSSDHSEMRSTLVSKSVKLIFGNFDLKSL
jgi:hypothetical protein